VVGVWCIRLSSKDLIGHNWGPDSHEVLDVTLRSDLIVAELLTFLDERIGKGNYLLALTADHGICPLPEVARAKGEKAGRVDQRELAKEAEAFLDQRFKPQSASAAWFESASFPWLYLNRRTLKTVGADEAEVAKTLAEWLKEQPGILRAYTRAQLLQDLPADDRLGEQVRRSFHPDRCGDVFVVLKPNYLFAGTYWTGTTHGMPHAYDTH